MRAVASLFAPYRTPLFFAQLVFLVKHSPVWALPILTADLINAISSEERASPHRLVVDGALLVGLILQNIPTHALYIRLISRTVRSVETDLRHELIRRLQQLSLGFLDRKPSGALQSKLMRDVEAVQGLAQMSLTLITSCGTSLALAIGITAVKQPVLLIFYALAVPMAAGLTFLFKRSLERRNRAFREHTEGLSARLMEMIHMLPLTRAHGLEEVEVDTMRGHLDRLRTQGLRVDLVNAYFGATWWCSSQLMQASCLLITIWMAWNRAIKPGDVVLYTSLFGMLVNAVGQIVDSIPAVSRGLESARSVRELLDTPELELHDGKPPVAGVRGAFSFEHVTFAYDGSSRPALADFTLHVDPGETIAFVGPSGSGKTTLMSLIIGFRRPQSGLIRLDGQDMAALDLRSYRRHLAVVPQQTILFGGTVRENITYGLTDISPARLEQVLAMARIDEFLPQLPHGLETLVGEHGAMLSGGQRQRIAIARALMRDPRVIILDEATSALDNVSERHIQDAIRDLIAGRTTFVVAHRLSTIRSANRIVVLKEGRIVETGTYAGLVARGHEFARLHAAAQ